MDFRDKWNVFCNSDAIPDHLRGTKDPSFHSAENLQQFLTENPVDVESVIAEREQLMSQRVGRQHPLAQRMRENLRNLGFKETWNAYVANIPGPLRGLQDPSQYSADVLEQFLARHALPEPAGFNH